MRIRDQGDIFSGDVAVHELQLEKEEVEPHAL